MATVTFDTLAYAGKLREAGVPANQAEAMARAQADALSTDGKPVGHQGGHHPPGSVYGSLKQS